MTLLGNTMSMYGREHPSPEVEKGQWIEYCRREERIQKYMCQKNGQPNGTFLIPPEVEEHDRKEHQSFFGFQNTTNDKTKTQYERLFNGDDFQNTTNDKTKTQYERLFNG